MREKNIGQASEQANWLRKSLMRWRRNSDKSVSTDCTGLKYVVYLYFDLEVVLKW